MQSADSNRASIKNIAPLHGDVSTHLRHRTIQLKLIIQGNIIGIGRF